jgi:hypothetical protein
VPGKLVKALKKFEDEEKLTSYLLRPFSIFGQPYYYYIRQRCKEMQKKQNIAHGKVKQACVVLPSCI